VVTHLWKSHIKPETPDEDIDDAWSNAKRAVATYLLWATRQSRERQEIARAVEELALIGIELDDGEPNAKKLDRMRELNDTIDTIRETSRPTTKESFDSLKHGERMTKEFFQRFQSHTSNSAIPELFVTGDWNATEAGPRKPKKKERREDKGDVVAKGSPINSRCVAPNLQKKNFFYILDEEVERAA